MATDPMAGTPHPKSTYPDQESTTLSNPNRTCHVLNLPYDIFYHIFTFRWIQPDDEDQDDFPLLASHVCRLWRQYALDTPSFWTSLKFHKAKPEIEKYHTWLERSKDTPFDLKISWQPFKAASVKHAKAIMRLVFPHIQRLRSLQVSHVPFKIRQVIFDRLNNVHLPSLETLDVERGWASDEGVTLTDRKFKPFRQGDAANMKHVVLKMIPYDYVIHRFKSLETLSIINRNLFGDSGRDNAKIVQNILLVLPDLRSLHIDVEQSWGPCPENPSLPPTTHSALEKLSLNAPESDVTAIACALVLPSLRRISYKSGKAIRIDPCCLPIMAQAPQGHPYANLLDLRLCGRQLWNRVHAMVDSLNMEFLERALAGLQRLESLILESVDLDHNRHLTCLSTTCPMLKRLNFIYCSGFALKELQAVIQSRRDPKGMGSNSLEHLQVDDKLPTLYRLHKEAKEQGLGGDVGFNIAISEIPKYPPRIVIICVE